MTTQKRGSAAFAVCGSFCTLETALEAARMLTLQGWDLLPIMSFAAGQDTRFGTGTFWKERLEALTGHPVLDTLQAVEPLGPRQMAQALVIAPCTGATLARLAAGLSDTPVTLAAKGLLRVGCPVLVGISTNDGLGASGENIARLFQRKHYALLFRRNIAFEFCLFFNETAFIKFRRSYFKNSAHVCKQFASSRGCRCEN